MKRRTFLQKAAVSCGIFAGSALSALAVPESVEAFGSAGGIDIEEALCLLESGKEKNTIPEIRPEILNNPRAVFLIETHVDVPRDNRGFFTAAQEELQQIGKDSVNRIFVKGTHKGGATLIKPNFTTVPDSVLSPVVGINTSPDFIAGFIHGLREIGNTNSIVSERGGNARIHRKTGIYSVFDKYDINLIETSYRRFSHYSKNELNWCKVPHPVVWKNIPISRPIGDSDTIFINMAKLKAHNLGLTTLCIKNLQGAPATGYGHYCNTWAGLQHLAEKSYEINFRRDFVKDYQPRVEAAFLKHRAEGYKHWDYEGYYPIYETRGGWETFKKIKDDPDTVSDFMNGIENLMWDEQWCQRAIDSAEAMKPTLNIIEGVIGRDGCGFEIGTDQLCNVILVSRSMLEIDAVGSYIMGHDPRELIYTRIAKERGLGENDPKKIDIYRLTKNSVEPVKNLEEIKRYRLGVNMHTRRKDTGKRLFW
ncbi:MAG: DUF362 domain-containing protein [Candidatus Latescibacteria bacterium]|nr:DUF362 domain-containing protein [Candidatus Latescibacterota bacterium]